MGAAFRIVTDLPVPPERAFALSLDIGAHLRSMAASGERAVAGRTSGVIRLGETVTWRARHLGVVWRMTNQVTVLEVPHTFVDEQVRGPFTRFRHEHRFERTPDGTRMVDEITFRAPFGPLGTIVEGLVLRRYLRELIVERNRSLVSELRAERGSGPVPQEPASSPSVS
ncbi:SRPBCC family protein [Curtobacterium sp. MCBD17_032]|uniref:SRPBCC family protein n=1 Tax=Curtobacterium sp. MCBD17_032 TaxID=2175659 RepID=UPI000DA9DFFD|nr:SRPBCC family protein [Curtobacterium sp. MCBD17_032]PZE85311.1 cyclase [Curtobacterium sp. MCBD17_032]